MGWRATWAGERMPRGPAGTEMEYHEGFRHLQRSLSEWSPSSGGAAAAVGPEGLNPPAGTPELSGVLREAMLMTDAAAIREDSIGFCRGQIDDDKLLDRLFHRLQSCLIGIEVVTVAMILLWLRAYAVGRVGGQALGIPEPESMEDGFLLFASAVNRSNGVSCLAFGLKPELAEAVARGDCFEKACGDRAEALERVSHSCKPADGLRCVAELFLPDSETWHGNVPKRQLSAF